MTTVISKEAEAAERLTYSVPEAAALLGIGRDLAYELVRTGQLRTVRLGRRIVVPRRALLELLDQQHAGPEVGTSDQLAEVVGGFLVHRRHEVAVRLRVTDTFRCPRRPATVRMSVPLAKLAFGSP